jgi:outer membrane biosynthesis protein TonB
MPRWRLAERILMERALPWSRVTAELERSLVQDVRLKSVQRTKGTDQTVQLKLRGESKNPEAEAEFIASLQKNLSFAQVILDREAEMTGRRSSLEFDYTLLLNTEPPPYETLPKFGPDRKPGWVETPAEPPPEPKPEKKAPEPQPPPPQQMQPPPQQMQAPQQMRSLRPDRLDRSERPDPREKTRPARRPAGALPLDQDGRQDGRQDVRRAR